MTITAYTLVYGVPTRDFDILFSGDEKKSETTCSIDGISFDMARLAHDQSDQFDLEDRVRFFDYLLETKLIDKFSSENVSSQKLAELLSTELLDLEISDEKRREWVSDETYKLIEYKYDNYCEIAMKEFVDTYLPEHTKDIRRKFHSMIYHSLIDCCDGYNNDRMIVGVKICELSIEQINTSAMSLDELLTAKEVYNAKINSLSDEVSTMFTQEPKLYFVQDDCGCCT